MSNTPNFQRLAFGLSLALLTFTAFWYSPYNEPQSPTRTTRLTPIIAEGENEENEENEEYDGPDLAAELEYFQTHDPATGTIPLERLVAADIVTAQAKSLAALAPESNALLNWSERGPDSDVAGPSGNSRPNNDKTGGRIRATWVDMNDNTGKTLWIGGVNGGLWKTTDITQSSPSWSLVNDQFSNLAVTGICQNPTSPSTLYFCTGEAYRNSDRASGVGVFKSTDGGASWSYLSSTSSYTSCSRIECDASGNVYLGTNGLGLVRSTNGGTSWTNITPTGLSASVTDFEISSTGRLHLCVGYYDATGGYRFTDSPSTVASGTWTAATSIFTYPTGNRCRIELACLGNTLYAAQSNGAGSGVINTIHKSTDGGVNWTSTTLTNRNILDLNGSSSASQGWYCMGLGIDPSNANNVVVGNLNCLKSTDGGATWAKMSEWASSSGQYVHADVHSVKWYDSGNKLVIASDGGIFYSSDKGTTIRDRNQGLRIKQFYSCAIHPSTTNYFLAGAQDNGVHQLTNAGLDASTEVYGGDGAFVAIDQNEPTYQFGSYTYNVYRRSINGGSTWTSRTWSSSAGLFINPWEYDNAANKIYGAWSAGSYFRWDDPTTAGTTASSVAVSAFNGASVSSAMVSPYTSHLVFFGTQGGRIVKIDNANTETPTATHINDGTGMPTTNVSCVNIGTNDNNLIASYSNYGTSSIWASTNGGTNWTAVEGNLPDVPVWWVMFFPNSNTKAFAATETGVWETTLLNGASTVWTPNPSFPNTRATMLRYRSSDQTLLASTHGRGLWTATITNVVLPVNLSYFKGKDKNGFANLDWRTESEGNNKGFEVEKSYDGLNFTKIGFVGSIGKSASPINYSFVDKTPLSIIQYYRLKQVDRDGKFTYSKVIALNNTNKSVLNILSLSNPFTTSLNIVFNQIIDDNLSVQFYDLSGRLVYGTPVVKGVSNQITVDVPPHLNNGFYVAQIRVGNQAFSKKVIKL